MGTRVLEGDARAVLGAHLGAKPGQAGQPSQEPYSLRGQGHGGGCSLHLARW